MKLRVHSVGTRVPAWVREAWQDFARRMPRECPLELHEIRAEPRHHGKPVEQLLQAEAHRIRNSLQAGSRCILLDERGSDLTTRDLARHMARWRATGDDIAFIIGGPDGLDPSLHEVAHQRLRLSSLTLPHALVRVVLAEQLYRAWSILSGHPYHRA